MMVLAVMVGGVVELGVMVMVLVGEIVLQVVRQAEEQLFLSAIVIGFDNLLESFLLGRLKRRIRAGLLGILFTRARCLTALSIDILAVIGVVVILLTFIRIESLHKELGITGQYDLVTVNVLAIIVKLEDEITELTILAQNVELLHGLSGVALVDVDKAVIFFLAYVWTVEAVHQAELLLVLVRLETLQLGTVESRLALGA